MTITPVEPNPTPRSGPPPDRVPLRYRDPVNLQTPWTRNFHDLLPSLRQNRPR